LFDGFRYNVFEDGEPVNATAGGSGRARRPRREALKKFVMDGAGTVKVFATDLKDRLLGNWQTLRNAAASVEAKVDGAKVNAFVESVYAEVKRLPSIFGKIWTRSGAAVASKDPGIASVRV
jgi:hypothetical protein